MPLLAIAYATLQVSHYPLVSSLYHLAFSLVAIIIGAVYVSVINDITDIKEDLVAGKTNRMSSLRPVVRMIIVMMCLSAGIACGVIIYPNRLSLFFYLMAWIVFSLYSIPPFRLKKRGVSGLICDASGAHLFPTLFTAAYLCADNFGTLGLGWYGAVGIWSLTYGLRGILWHQFYDRNNDLKSGTSTYASQKSPEDFQASELIIFVVEISAFSVIFYKTLSTLTMLSLVLYILLVLIRKLAFDYRISLIVTPEGLPHQILMNDFYLVFFPLAQLGSLAMTERYGWIVLCIHMVLFPRKTILVVYDFVLFLKTSLKP